MLKQFFAERSAWFAVVIILTLFSCKKEIPTPVTPHPEMEYFNLNNREIKANAAGFSIDVNHDGRQDLHFGTLLVGDPIYQVDKLQFLVTTNIAANLPVNSNEEIPVMENGELILPADFNGYHWFELSSIILVQKITSVTQPVFWDGHWKNATHKYLPYQVMVDNKRYNGWVELSVDITAGKLVLHKAAVSKEADRIIKAGE
jgi:hypothetical protein